MIHWGLLVVAFAAFVLVPMPMVFTVANGLGLVTVSTAVMLLTLLWRHRAGVARLDAPRPSALA